MCEVLMKRIKSGTAFRAQGLDWRRGRTFLGFLGLLSDLENLYRVPCEL